MSDERSEPVETGERRLPGSGTVPRVFALVVLAAITVFVGVWGSTRADGLPDPLGWVLEGLALAAVVRSLFVGVFLDADGVLVRGWFRSYRYRRGGLREVTAVPYWRFLDRKDPFLSCLKFTPESGWVREISATVAWRDRAAAHAAAIAKHLA